MPPTISASRRPGELSTGAPLRRLLIAAALAVALAPGATAAPLSAVDARGRMITLALPPQRIVSLAPATTEMLFAIGAGPRVVGVSRYCDYPNEARSRAKIGDLNTSIERVIALRPDLVVASDSANRRAVEHLERLRGRRTPVFCVDPNTFEELYTALRALGAITGASVGAERVERTMREEVRRVQGALARTRKRPRVAFLLQTRPVWVAGPDTFVDDLIRMAGGVNVAAGAGTGYRPYPLEKLIAQRPEALLMRAPDDEDLASRPAWSGMPAVRTGALHSVGDEAVRPGPRLTVALARLARLLHPEAFTRQDRAPSPPKQRTVPRR